MTDLQLELIQRHGKITGYLDFDPDSDGGSEGREYQGEATRYLAKRCKTSDEVAALKAEIGVDLPLESTVEAWIEAFRDGWEEALEEQCRSESGAQWDY